MRGTFKNDLPCVEIEVRGLGETKTLEVVVDTGHNGHLTLPQIDAFPLGLRLDGIEDTQLADGTSSKNLVCRGEVTCDGKTVTTVIDIFPDGMLLMGNSLLRKLNKKVISDIVADTVEIVESEGPRPAIQLEEREPPLRMTGQ